MTLETLNKHVDEVSKAIEKTGSSVDVSPEEKAEVKKLVNLFYKYKKYRANYDQKWLEYYKMFRGCQWGDRPRWKNSEIVNMVWSTIQQNVPLQTDVRPKFQFLPQNPEDVEIAKVLEEISNSDWEKYNWLRQVTEVIYDGSIYGTGFSSMTYNKGLEYGIGGCEYKSEEVFYCYPDPDSKDINDEESIGFFKAYPITTSKLKARFPDKSEEIKPDIADFVTKAKSDLKTFTYNGFNTDLEMPEGHWGGMQEGTRSMEKTLVIEGFLKPQDVYECADENAGTNEKKYILKKKYPQGRHVLIANGMLLVDEPLQTPNVIPFSKYNNYILPREFYGVSDVEQLESPQRVFNKILSFTLDCLALTSNPVWIVDTNSDVDTDNLSNVPGGVVEKNPGSEVRRAEGAQLNPGLLQILDKLVVWFNDTAGNSEFSRGQAPGGVTAASAIEQLIAASRTRIRQKQRNLDEYLKTVGEQYKHLVLTKYSFPKVYRLVGENASITWRKFYIDASQEQPVAVTEKWEQQPDGEIKKVEDRKLVIAGDFDIVVRTGSDLPFETASREQKAYQLFDRGIIDGQQLLEDIQYPNREKVLARLAEQQQLGMAPQQPQKGA